MFRSKVAIAAFAIAAIVSASRPASAQQWADSSYRYRRPLTLANTSTSPLNPGDVVALTYLPGVNSTFGGNTLASGQDVKVFYYDGTKNIELPQYQFSMGAGTAKVLFPLQAGVAGATYPVAMTENTNAGASTWSQVLAETPDSTAISALSGQDDAATVVNIPFTFTFNGTNYTTLSVATDGFIRPGSGGYNQRPDNPTNAASNNLIVPFSSDFATTGPDPMGVYMNATSDHATIRWAVQESASGPVIANFAAILYKNGDVRFVYGPTVKSPSAGVADPNTNGSYWPVVYGVGLGDPTKSLVHVPTFPADMSNHADILYTANLNPQPPVYPTVTGYWVYYGNSAETGTRIALPSDKLVVYNFDDNTTQGWAVPSGIQAKEAATLTAHDGLLELTSSSDTGHPMAIAAGQSVLTGDQTVYGKIRPTANVTPDPGNSNETALFARATDAAKGYGLGLDAFGSSLAIFGRTGPGAPGDYNTLGSGISFGSNAGSWDYGILSVVGTGTDTVLHGKAFHNGSFDPGAWQVTGLPKYNVHPEIISDSGVAGFGGYTANKNTNHPELDFAVITGGHAEDVTSSFGAQEQQALGTNGIVQGSVTDATTGAALSGATVTLTPTAGGSAITLTTGALGEYTAIVTPGAYNVAFAAAGYTGSTGTATVAQGATASASATLTATGTPTNPTYYGQVVDATGNPVSNISVGIRETPYNGLADPLLSVYTDPRGRFAFTVPASAQGYGVQAWKSGYAPSANVTVGAPTSVVTVPFAQQPVYNIAAGHTAFASSVDLGNPEGNAIDGNMGTRYISVNPLTDPNQFIAFDLGRTVDFSKVKDIAILWEAARAGGYDVRVGTTPPAPDMTPAQAATYGTSIYSVTDPGGRRSVAFSGAYPDIITPQTSASGRYVIISQNATGPYQVMSIWEFRVDVAGVPMTGRVIDTSGAPVAGAAVGVFPNGVSYATTDANGNYSFVAPIGIPVQAHKVTADASTVYPLSTAYTPASEGATSVNFVLPNPVANAIPKGTSAFALSEDTNGAATNATDWDFSTRWVTAQIGDQLPTITPTSNQFFQIDLASPVTMNQIVIHWENARPGAYTLEVSPDGNTYTPVYTTSRDIGAYHANLPNGLRTLDVVPFASQQVKSIKITVNSDGPVTGRISIWEVQGANATNLPPLPPSAGDVIRALQIAGGLTASGTQDTGLDIDKNNVINLQDAAALARKINGK